MPAENPLPTDSQPHAERPGQPKRRARLSRSVAEGVAAWRSAGSPPALPPEPAEPHSANGGRPGVALRPYRLGGRRRGRPARYRRPVPAPEVALPGPDEPGVLAPLPRSRFLSLRSGDTTPPKMRRMVFEARPGQALVRLLVWLGTLIVFLGSNGLDALLGRSTQQRRAQRLRQAFERMGGSGVKIGQYLAMRLDFLPWVYCVELSQMLDTEPPFPVEHAIAAIERRTGQPLSETFARFDPEPVGSDSVAGVYQGLLRSGERVVVRVRRPGVGALFAADLQVLDWFLLGIEFLTILRPGFSAQMRREFRAAVFGNLDFVQEARYQDSFRRAAKRSGKGFFTAPRVYFEYSGEDIIVEEFVSGMWIWELLAGIDQQDERVLGLARELNIDPAVVAQRLLWINFWGWDASFFFHADPHPDNIIIGRDGRLTFLDFSSVGAIDPDRRAAMHRNMYYMGKNDPLGMARASLALLEPLPPIDVIEFTKELETYNWQMLYVRASQKMNKVWRDRATAIQWIGLFRVAGKYGITMDFQALRLLRAMLLCDTLGARLHPDIDAVREYRRYARYRARQAQRRAIRRVERRLKKGLDRKIFLRLERMANMTEGLFARVRHLLSIPAVNYNALMGKGSYAIFTLVQFALQAAVVTVVSLGAVALAQYLTAGTAPQPMAIVERLLANPWYQLLLLVVFVLNTRSVLFHLDDVDV